MVPTNEIFVTSHFLQCMEMRDQVKGEIRHFRMGLENILRQAGDILDSKTIKTLQGVISDLRVHLEEMD